MPQIVGQGIRFCLLAVVAGITMASDTKEDQAIISHGDTTITVFDVRQAVDAQVPRDTQFQLYGDEKKLREFIGSMFVRAKLAEMARSRELTEEERWKIKETERRVLSQIEIERQIAARGAPEFDEYIREVYVGSPERFREPEAVRARHILVATAERSEDDALAIAEELYQRAQDGEDFEALAVEYSEDRSVQKNKGDLGFFERGRMVKPFEKAAFGLENSGDISEPVKSRFGYHVIQLVERRPARQKSFEEARPALERDELKRYRTDVVNELVAEISSLDGVEIDNETLTSLIQRVEDLPRKRAKEVKDQE